MGSKRLRTYESVELDQVLRRQVCGSIAKCERRMLYQIVRAQQPQIVVETGSGASTLCILLALKHNGKGHLYSFDSPGFVNKECRAQTGEAEKVRYLWEEIKGTYSGWHIYDGDIKTTVPAVVKKLSKIDMFFHDSGHSSEHLFFECDVIFPKLCVDGCFGMHDIGHLYYEEFEEWFRKSEQFQTIGTVRNIEFWKRVSQ